MEILMIGFTNIKFMPYLHYYLNLIEELTNEYYDIKIDVAFWNRANILENDSRVRKFYSYNKEMSDDIPTINKIPRIYMYRRFLKKIFKNNDYDLIIVFHSTTAFIIKDVLGKKYEGKYIFDYRDVTYERNRFFKKGINKVIKKSVFTVSSSRGFINNLPELKNTLLLHNISETDQLTAPFPLVDKLVLRFWGFVRHISTNKKIIEMISMDNRFELHYHGRVLEGTEELRSFAKELNAKNVFFHGEYTNKRRVDFAKKTHIIHNFYENDYKTIGASGNKFYDGLIFKIPQICSKGSYMGEMVETNKVGLSLSLDDSLFLDKIYNYYTKIDWDLFFNNSEKLLKNVIQENDVTNKKIKEKIKEMIEHV